MKIIFLQIIYLFPTLKVVLMSINWCLEARVFTRGHRFRPNCPLRPKEMLVQLNCRDKKYPEIYKKIIYRERAFKKGIKFIVEIIP